MVSKILIMNAFKNCEMLLKCYFLSTFNINEDVSFDTSLIMVYAFRMSGNMWFENLGFG